MNRKIVAFVLVFAATVFLLAGIAAAHKVNIFAYAEDGTVFTESYFSDGRPVQNGTIEVFDAHKHKLLEGHTDSNGKFSFPLPKQEDLTLILNAGLGHKNQFILRKEDM